jgi:superfamily II DNA or RNA helicase
MLRDYQERSELEIYKAWETFRRVMFQLPTGGGKTIIVTNITRKYFAEGARVLFMAHREELISQAWATFNRHNLFAGIIKADVKPNYSLPIQIGSVQTVARRAKLPPADVVIIDEAHHALDDNSYGKICKEHFPNAKVLGVTATPYRLNGRGFRSMFDTLVESVQISDLVAGGWLVPIRYFIAFNPDLSRVRMNAGDYNIEDAAGVMGHAPIVKSYLEHCQGKSGMVFAVSVEHSNKIVSDYLAAGISAAHIDANTPDPIRRKILNDFKAKIIKIVSNVGIATEGFDMPNMDFVQLARPTKSLGLFLQMIGRGTRVDNDVIKGLFSADERRLVIAASSKPHCIILDNAGLFKEHGLPDAHHDWSYHFKGYLRQKKKSQLEDIIEIIEFVAEDENGRRVRSEVPEEIEGLTLVEINKTIKSAHRDALSIESAIRELNDADHLARHLKDEHGAPRVKKIGFFVFDKFMNYCRKEKLLVRDEIWEILLRRLYTEPHEKELGELSLFNNVIDALRAQYADAPELGKMEDIAKAFVDKKIAEIKAVSLPKSYLIDQRKEYFERIAQASKQPVTQ